MQIGEILFRAARAVERFHVGLELDQIAADKARGEAAMAEQLAQQPGGIAAGAAHFFQRLLRRLHAGFEADGVFDVLPEPLVDGDEKSFVRGFSLSGHFQPLLFGAPFGFAEQIAARWPSDTS